LIEKPTRFFTFKMQVGRWHLAAKLQEHLLALSKR